jgi:hypothetical protein
MVTIRNATQEQIHDAIIATSLVFGGNILCNRFDTLPNGTTHYVTLKVVDSHRDGARVGFTGRAMAHACWHVYGTFFDELFIINRNAIILAMDRRMTAYGGNWIDTPRGQGRMYSDMCRCEENPDLMFDIHATRRIAKAMLSGSIRVTEVEPTPIKKCTSRFDIPLGVEEQTMIETPPVTFGEEE